MNIKKSTQLSDTNLDATCPDETEAPTAPTARKGLVATVAASVLSLVLLVAVASSIWGPVDETVEQASPVAVGENDNITERAGAVSVQSAAAAPGVIIKTPSKPVTKVTTKPNSTTTKKPTTGKVQNGPAPTVVVSATTPAPTSTPVKGVGIEGSKIPNGATVGKDIPAGRYWAKNCWSWSLSNTDGTIASSSYRFAQSVVDLRNGEFFLTSTKCTWYPGNPPAATILPTGKVIVGEQLTVGRWRAVNQEGCVTGPTSTRDRAAITDPSKMIVWWSNTADLVVSGNEGWSAYLVGLECGGLVKVG